MSLKVGCIICASLLVISCTAADKKPSQTQVDYETKINSAEEYFEKFETEFIDSGENQRDVKNQLQARKTQKSEEQIIFQQVNIVNTESGERAIEAYVINTTGSHINNVVVSIQYWSDQKNIYEKKHSLKMNPYEKRQVNFRLKNIHYTGVTISLADIVH